MEKVLSIIIPMYNAHAYIMRCLNSLLLDEESMRSFEILVVNDGSADGCEKLAASYVNRYPDTIRLLDQPNGGHGAAVNHGVDACRGTYFKVLDADDWFQTAALRRLIETIKTMPDADVLLNGYQTYDIRTKKTETFTAGMQKALSMQEVIAHWSRYKWLFTLHGIIYRTDFYKNTGWRLPEHVYYEDAFFHTVYASYAEKIIDISGDVLYVYRVGSAGQSISKKNRELRIGQLETVLDAMLKTGAGQRSKSRAGRQYWNRKMAAAVSDYYITSFLRFEDRRKGRRKAAEFTAKLKKNHAGIFARVRKKYWLLRLMGLTRMDDEHLRRLTVRIKGGRLQRKAV